MENGPVEPAGAAPDPAPTPAAAPPPADRWRGPSRYRVDPAPGFAAMCVAHADVPATRKCDRCRAPMCETCDFAFPDGTHACPACVADPVSPVSGGRTMLAVLGLIAVGTATACLAAVMAGAVELDEDQAGTWFTLLVFLPSLLALVLSCSAMSKRRGNNALLWTATVWSGLMAATMVIMVVIGNLKS